MSKRRIWRGNSASAPQGLRASFRIWARFDVRFGARFTAGGGGARGVWRKLPAFPILRSFANSNGQIRSAVRHFAHGDFFGVCFVRRDKLWGARGTRSARGTSALSKLKSLRRRLLGAILALYIKLHALIPPPVAPLVGRNSRAALRKAVAKAALASPFFWGSHSCAA